MKLNKTSRNNLITYALVLISFAIIFAMDSFGLTSRQMQSLLVPVCINIILAISLNLVVGFLGELSLGHAGFMSVGAYSGCLFSIYMDGIIPDMLRFPAAMLVGGIVAGIFGLIVGIPVLRLKGDYLAIVTLAFGEIVRSIIINLGITGGAAGLKGTPRDSTFVIAFVVLMITLIFITNITNSRDGRAITSIRDNKIAAEACGLNVNYYKLMVFVVAAFFAGIAGVIYGHNLSVVTASVFDYNKSIEILVIVVLGGMGSIRGSIISAVLITVLPEALRGLQDYRMLIYAVLLIIVMLVSSAEQFAGLRAKLDIKNLRKATKKEEVQ
ncbi:MAG: branched-chain amino acid ABC transporter permease [Clostridia bacterium]